MWSKFQFQHVIFWIQFPILSIISKFCTFCVLVPRIPPPQPKNVSLCSSSNITLSQNTPPPTQKCFLVFKFQHYIIPEYPPTHPKMFPCVLKLCVKFSIIENVIRTSDMFFIFWHIKIFIAFFCELNFVISVWKIFVHNISQIINFSCTLCYWLTLLHFSYFKYYDNICKPIIFPGSIYQSFKSHFNSPKKFMLCQCS